MAGGSFDSVEDVECANMVGALVRCEHNRSGDALLEVGGELRPNFSVDGPFHTGNVGAVCQFLDGTAVGPASCPWATSAC